MNLYCSPPGQTSLAGGGIALVLIGKIRLRLKLLEAIKNGILKHWKRSFLRTFLTPLMPLTTFRKCSGSDGCAVSNLTD